MTGDYFQQYMHMLNKKMKKAKRKILMIMDNFSGHTKLKLSNIELLFIPPNTTSILQPLDLGIIRNFKYHYRFKSVQFRIANIEKYKKDINIDMLQVLCSIVTTRICYLYFISGASFD